MVAGPLDFGLVGVLLSIAQPLAGAEIGIFAVSTYDTDYVLVKESSLEAAVAALSEFGHRIIWEAVENRSLGHQNALDGAIRRPRSRT